MFIIFELSASHSVRKVTSDKFQKVRNAIAASMCFR